MFNKKRGQFYLIAAIIIIAIILGFVAIRNFTNKSSTTVVYDLSQELGFEGGEVLEYGTFTGNDKIQAFAIEYSDYADEEGRQIYFVYGDERTVKVATIQKIVSGEITINIGESQPEQEIEDDAFVEETTETDGQPEVTIRIGDNEYPFALKSGENFYFIISQEIGGETHIVQG